MDISDIEDLIEKALRQGWRIACEVPLSQFGDQAQFRAAEFTDYLTELARDGLHIDYEGSWGIALQMPVDLALLDQLPGKITRGISHQLNPRVLRLTFSRITDVASASRAA